MAVSTIPAATSGASLPAGATALVYQGNVAKGTGFYTTSLAAGNYIVVVSPSENTGTVSINSPANALYTPDAIANQPSYIQLTNADSYFTVGAGPVLGRENAIFSGDGNGGQYNITGALVIGTSLYFPKNNGTTTTLCKATSLNSQLASTGFATYTTTALSYGYKKNAYGNSIGIIQAGNNAANNVYFRTLNAGSTWATITPTGLATAPTRIFFGSVNNYFVAITYGATTTTSVYSSTDGLTWGARTTVTSTNILRDGTYGGNAYVVVGDNGTINSSTDSITWANRTSGTSITIQSIAYGNGIFVCGFNNSGTQGTQQNGAYSTDGTTWTLTSINGRGDGVNLYVQKLGFANGYFYALLTQAPVNLPVVSANYDLHISTNGINWRVTSANSYGQSAGMVYSTYAFMGDVIPYGTTVFGGIDSGGSFYVSNALVPQGFTVSIYSAA